MAQITATLATRVIRLHQLVHDTNACFSRSVTLTELEELEQLATKSGAPELLRDILLMIGVVEGKGGDPTHGASAIKRALTIPGIPTLPARNLVQSHFQCATFLADLGDYSAAADQYLDAIRFMTNAPEFSEDERLGTAQQQAFALHEGMRYGEALNVNVKVLSGGEHLHGPDSPLLTTVLINIAQNLHAMQRGSEAEPYLERALLLARRKQDLAQEQDLLFQLGVLAFELGRPDHARQRMRERIGLLRANDQPDLLELALEDLEHLENQLRTGPKHVVSGA